jgi:hypothetical protein
MEKSSPAGAETVMLPLAACVPDAAAPVTVKVELPPALELADSVSAALPPALTDDGLNDAVTPGGNPLAESVMVCALPEVTAVETVNEALLPGAIVALDGESEMEKSFEGGGAEPLSVTSS